MSSAGETLRALMRRDGATCVPGAYDGLTARLVEGAGFEAVYMTGAGTAMSLGYPDYGLVTMSEMVGNAGVMAQAIGVPLIADADTGYGNELNVTRTVREFESRGVAAIHIEDQSSPKRCGHLNGKDIVSRERFFSTIRAAVAARRDPSFVIIARSDARAVAGFDEAVARANGALALGADVAFVEAPETLEEVASVAKLVDGPCVLNVVPGGKTPPVSVARAQEMGYKLIIYPGLLIAAVITASDDALRILHETGKPPALAPTVNVAAAFARLRAGEWDALRREFSDVS